MISLWFRQGESCVGSFAGSCLAIRWCTTGSFGNFFAFYIHRLQVKTHELAIGLIFSRPLLSIADELASRVKVELDGVEVKNLNLLVYGIKNSGTQAILVSDFERLISVSLAGGKVVSAHVIAQKPKNINASVHFSDSMVEVRLLLFNPSDQVLIQILVSASELSPLIGLGVINIVDYVSINNRTRLPPYFQSGALFVILMLLIFALGSWAFIDRREDAFAMTTWFLVSAVASLAISLFLRFGERFGVAARRRIDEE